MAGHSLWSAAMRAKANRSMATPLAPFDERRRFKILHLSIYYGIIYRGRKFTFIGGNPMTQGTSDSESFGLACMEQYEILFNTARKLCEGDTSRAEDLVQDTMVNGIRYRQHFNQGTNLRAWLFAILRNRHRNQLKRNREIHMEFNDDLLYCRVETKIALEPAHLAVWEQYYFDDDVMAAMDSLAPIYRATIEAVDLCQLTYKEAAQLTGCSTGTVMSRLSRGRRKLAIALRRRRMVSSHM